MTKYLKKPKKAIKKRFFFHYEGKKTLYLNYARKNLDRQFYYYR